MVGRDESYNGQYRRHLLVGVGRKSKVKCWCRMSFFFQRSKLHAQAVEVDKVQTGMRRGIVGDLA